MISEFNFSAACLTEHRHAARTQQSTLKARPSTATFPSTPTRTSSTSATTSPTRKASIAIGRREIRWCRPRTSGRNSLVTSLTLLDTAHQKVTFKYKSCLTQFSGLAHLSGLTYLSGLIEHCQWINFFKYGRPDLLPNEGRAHFFDSGWEVHQHGDEPYSVWHHSVNGSAGTFFVRRGRVIPRH